jgi:DNA repair protein RecO (recombination protein O)
MNSDLQPAFVLHRRAFGESSQIVELLTRDHGRIGALAKGSRSAARGALRVDPFQLLGISLRGRGELPLLVRSEPLQQTPAPMLSGMASLAGLYLNELLLALLQRDDPHPQLFDCYRVCLDALAPAPAPALRRFEWALLRELGYAPDLQTAADGERIDPALHYQYDPQGGLVGSVKGRWSGQMLLALLEGRGDQAGAQRLFLREQLSLHLDGQRLRSWDLLGEIDQLLPGI